MIIKKVMPKIPVAKKRVAAYCRVSTFRNEQDESFETQQMQPSSPYGVASLENIFYQMSSSS